MSGARRRPPVGGRVEVWVWWAAAVMVMVTGVIGALTGFLGALLGCALVASYCVLRALSARRGR